MGFVERHNRQSYEFGTFRLALDERRLYRQGELVSLPPKEFDLLLLLVRNARQPLGRENLIKALWPNTVVEEANLNVHISALRKALAEGSGEQQYIETLPRLGYRFIAPVVAVDEPDGQWVYFARDRGDSAIWRISVNGGTETCPTAFPAWAFPRTETGCSYRKLCCAEAI